ncbi:MAG: XdhC family protein [Thermoplasmata archaeon]
MQTSHYSKHLAVLVARREPFAIATVTRTEGSTLAKPGFKILITPPGEIAAGTLGGGCPEGPIVEAALETLRTGSPRVLRIHLVDTEEAVSGTVRESDPNEIWVQTNCGGTLEVYIEPMLPTPRLILIGQGGRDDVEGALVHLSKVLGFDVVVVDPAPALPEPPHELIIDAHLDVKKLGLSGHDYVVVLTKGERDVEVLEALSTVPLRFVGLLASRHRVKEDLDELARRGVSQEFRAALHAPIGLDIGSKTPEELAVAILGEVIATKYGKNISRPAPVDR